VGLIKAERLNIFGKRSRLSKIVVNEILESHGSVRLFFTLKDFILSLGDMHNPQKRYTQTVTWTAFKI